MRDCGIDPHRLTAVDELRAHLGEPNPATPIDRRVEIDSEENL